MKYPFMTRNDGTEITFSDIKIIDDNEQVEVYFERWSKEHNDFDYLRVKLPGGIIVDGNGFGDVEKTNFVSMSLQYEPLFFKFAKQGGIGNRAEAV